MSVNITRIFKSETTLSHLQSMIKDCVVSPEDRLTTIGETKRETRSKLFEDSFEISHEAATSDIDGTCAGNQPVRGISPVQIDMKEVFALLAGKRAPVARHRLSGNSGESGN